MMMFGIIAVGLHFFAVFSLENAVEQASRPIRTGQAQQAGMTKEQFKQSVCDLSPSIMKCDLMRVSVVEAVGSSPVIPSCTDAGGNLVPPPPTTAPNPNPAPSVNVVVTVCYEWELPGTIPFLKIGSMSNGSSLLQASTSFKTEPYQ
jgi:Flp pilus assembly protein TadG